MDKKTAALVQLKDLVNDLLDLDTGVEVELKAFCITAGGIDDVMTRYGITMMELVRYLAEDESFAESVDRRLGKLDAGLRVMDRVLAEMKRRGLDRWVH